MSKIRKINILLSLVAISFGLADWIEFLKTGCYFLHPITALVLFSSGCILLISTLTIRQQKDLLTNTEK